MTISANERKKLHEITIAALLHDIGKFMQRTNLLQATLKSSHCEEHIRYAQCKLRDVAIS